MVGLLPPIVGGITTYILNILGSNLNEIYEFIPFTTSRPTIGLIKDVYDHSLLYHIGFNYLIKSIITTVRHLIEFPFMLIIKNPRIIHIHTTDYWPFWESSIYVLVSKIFSRRTILHIHSPFFNRFYENGSDLLKFLIIRTLNSADKVIVLSLGWKKFFTKLISEEKLIVIPNTIKASKFMKHTKIKPIEKFTIKVIFIGGSEAKRKGIFDILKAIPFVIKQYGENILFIFLGRCDINKLKTICKEKKIDKYVKFLGYVKEDVKIKILTSSDIFILPSYAEGLPIAMLEAMAAGLPVISTHVGSIPDVIKEGVNGYLIKPGDYYALADRILKLAKDSKLRQKIGEKNKEKILMEYDIKFLTNKMSELYNKSIRT